MRMICDAVKKKRVLPRSRFPQPDCMGGILTKAGPIQKRAAQDYIKEQFEKIDARSQAPPCIVQWIIKNHFGKMMKLHFTKKCVSCETIATRKERKMKKLLLLLLTFALCFSLCSCGKSDAAKVCEDLIEKIGEVTLDSESVIEIAEEAYEALSEEEKEQIKKSAETLIASRETYNQMVIDAKLSDIVDLIDAIGEVTLNSEEAIIAAEEAFAALPEEEKALIEESGVKLEASRAAYDTALMEKNASEVISSIDNIGAVSLEAKDTIEAARSLYNALTNEEQALVTNYDNLEAAEAELDTLVEAEKQRLLDEYLPKFNIKEDKVQGITWYRHKNEPQYIDNRCFVIPYVGVRNGEPWICIRYDYTSSEWVFYDEIIILADDVRYTKDIGSFATTRDNAYRKVWEVYDEVLKTNQDIDTEEIQILEAIANSQETIIRFNGDGKYHDYYVIAEDKQMISDALALYRALLS